MRFLVSGKIMLLILFMILLFSFVAATHINEIMYNPAGADNNFEYIEIETDQDLSGWIITDNKSNDTLIKIKEYPNNFSLITEDGFNHSDINATVYSAGATIGDNLNNLEDFVYLYDSNYNLIDSVYYDNTYADNNGFSLELINGSWQESCSLGGSPGEENGFGCISDDENSDDDPNDGGEADPEPGGDESENPGHNESLYDLKLSVYLSDVIYLNQGYDKLFQINNVNYELGAVNDVTVEYNITTHSEIVLSDSFVKDEVNRYTSANTGFFKPVESGNYSICGRIVSSSIIDSNPDNDYACTDFEVIDTSLEPCNISLNITFEEKIYSLGDTLNFKIDLNNKTFPYVIEYWAEDLFGNIKKSKYESSNTNQKSWTPKLDERDQVFLIKARIASVLCDDDPEDNYYEKFVIFKDENFEAAADGRLDDLSDDSSDLNSSITIQSLSLGTDNKIEFGKTVMANVKIYKGDTRKYSVQFYVRNQDGVKVSSATSTASFYTKYTDYELKVPVQLKPDCDFKYGDGDYFFVADGLDNLVEQSFKIEGITSILCKESSESCNSPTSSSKKNSEYFVDSIPEKIESGEPFTVSVRIDNNFDEEYDFELIGYVYRGSKQYSDELIKEVTVPRRTSMIVKLRNIVEDVESGEYKYKVKIKREGLKTYKNLNSDIFIEDSRCDIDNFEIRTENISDARIYAEVSCEGGNVTLESFENTVETELSGSLIFPVRIYNGRNIFFLKLEKGGEIRDVKMIDLEFDPNAVGSEKVKIDMYSKEFLMGDFELDSGNAEVVYLSSSAKAENVIPYLIIFTFGLIIVIFIFKWF